ncbi:MAG: hypothetical protein MZV70_19840 [Desulfobacterales bacterium]|nr:hypothetical protein [Desulfobacterales bacterium]
MIGNTLRAAKLATDHPMPCPYGNTCSSQEGNKGGCLDAKYGKDGNDKNYTQNYPDCRLKILDESWIDLLCPLIPRPDRLPIILMAQLPTIHKTTAPEDFPACGNQIDSHKLIKICYPISHDNPLQT